MLLEASFEVVFYLVNCKIAVLNQISHLNYEIFWYKIQ